MRKKWIRLTVIFLMFTVIFNACVKEDDFSLKNVEGIDPVFAIPLLNTEMSIEKILNLTGDDDNTVQVELNDNGVKIVFKDTLSIPLNIEKKKKRTKLDESKIIIHIDREIGIDIFSKKISGGCVFDTTLFELWIKGEYGGQAQGESIPVSIQNTDLELVSKDGVSTPISDFSVNDPISIEQRYNKLLDANPNTLFSQFEPKTLRYSFDLVLDTSLIGSVLPQSIDIAMYFGISLNLSANILLNDTLAFNMNLSDDDIDNSGTNGISADFLYRFENTFPLDLNLQLYFLDASMNVIDSLFYNGGEKIIANNNTLPQVSRLPIGKDRLKRLNKSPHVILQAGLTSNGAQARILPKHKLKVLLGAKIYTSGLDFKL